MRTIQPIKNHFGHSVETDRSFQYYLLDIEHGNYIAGSYTKTFIEHYVENNIPKAYRHLYEIVER